MAWVNQIKKVVGGLASFCRGWLSRPDIHKSVDLAAVSIDNFAVEPLGQMEGQTRFAYGSGADDEEDRSANRWAHTLLSQALGSGGGLGYFHELRRLQAGAAYQRTVDTVLGHETGGITRVNAAAVEQGHMIRGITE